MAARFSSRPQPIRTAPREEGRRLLLFCPVEGWVTGDWFDGRWVDALTLEHELHPSHYLDLPPEPTDAAEIALERMLRNESDAGP
jgi:hypothetical protein